MQLQQSLPPCLPSILDLLLAYECMSVPAHPFLSQCMILYKLMSHDTLPFNHLCICNSKDQVRHGRVPNQLQTGCKICTLHLLRWKFSSHHTLPRVFLLLKEDVVVTSTVDRIDLKIRRIQCLNYSGKWDMVFIFA